MMLLLDTCTLLWLVADADNLPPRTRERIARHSASLFVSAISAFEIGQKAARKALKLPLPSVTWYERALTRHGIHEQPVTGAIALQATTLPAIHNDPFDRIIIATAHVQGLTILTPDTTIASYPNTLTFW